MDVKTGRRPTGSGMPALQCCRACLATDVRMCPLERYELGRSYTALVGYACDAGDGLPSAVCYECAHRLDAFRSFRKRGRRAHAVLQGLLEEHGEITAPSVRKIDRTQIRPAPSLISLNLKPIDIEPTFNNTPHYTLKLEQVEPESEDIEVVVNTGSKVDEMKLVEIEFKGKPERCPDNLDYYVSFVPGVRDETEVLTKPEKNDPTQKKEVKKNTEKIELENDKVVPKRKRVTKNAADGLEQAAEDDAMEVMIVEKVKSNEDEIVLKKKASEPDEVKTDVRKVGEKKKQSRTRLRDRPRVQYSAEYHNSFATVTVMTEEEQVECFKQRQNTERYKKARYKCPDCYTVFVTKPCYDTHRGRHDDPSQGSEVCNICKMRLKSASLLKKHIAMNHRTKFACKKCPHTCMSGSKARIHESTHTDKPYPCTVCGSVFKTLSSYRLHQSRMHPSLLACPMCGLTYLGQGAVNKHRANMHSGAVDTADCKELCECGTRFLSEEARSVHRSSHPQHADLDDNAFCESRGACETRDARRAVSQLEREIVRIYCEFCEEKFPDLEATLKHRMSHAQVMVSAEDRECEQCGLVMSGRENYVRHLHHAHPEKTPTKYPSHIPGCGVMCELCGNVCPSSSHYRNHMILHHHGETPHKCDICNKSFTNPYILNEHRRIHTKERPYQCAICNKKFTYKSGLTRHRLVHTDDTPFSCDVCGKYFKHRYAVKYHIQYVHLKKPWPKRDCMKRHQETPDSD